jgi:hypothetical protein
LIVAAVATTVVLAACGGGARQDANEPSGKFTVAIPAAKFPASQRLSEHTHLVLTVRNDSSRTIPDVAVSICNGTCAYPAPPGEGTSAQAFSTDLNQQYLANPSRPVWIVDQPPGQCSYSCQQGGAGGAVTAYSNTWALGALQPGHTATFDWGVTAVKPGKYTVAWQVAAGLGGKAKAILPDGSTPQGKFSVRISSAPPQSFVNDQGQVVTKP